MSIKLVMPSNHLILCHSLLLLLSIFPSIRVFTNESAFHNRWPKYWSFSFGFLNICLLVGFLVHMLVLFLVFKEISILSSILACINWHYHQQECSLFSTPSPAFTVCRVFDGDHSDGCEVVSHCSFDLYFSNNEWCWASFHVFINNCMSSLEKCLFKSFPTFWLDCFFFWFWIVLVAYIFWKLIFCQLFPLLLFSPILRVIFLPFL